MKMQRGFTLIELVVVIIILGIMAAIAVPKFVDITSDAHTAAARGVAAALSSGSSVNFATRTANVTKGVAIGSATSCTPAVVQPLLTSTTSPKLVSAAPATDDEFQIGVASGGSGDCSAGAASAQCSITPKGSGVTAATVTLLCVL